MLERLLHLVVPRDANLQGLWQCGAALADACLHELKRKRSGAPGAFMTFREGKLSPLVPRNRRFEVGDHPASLGIGLRLLEDTRVQVTKDMARRRSSRPVTTLGELMAHPCSLIELHDGGCPFESWTGGEDGVAHEAGVVGTPLRRADEGRLEMVEWPGSLPERLK